MQEKRYKKSELDVHAYGSGKNKKFIIYTDFEQVETSGPRWNTRVYPDIQGNQAKAIKQALKWLNILKIEEPWVDRRPSKVFVSYSGPSSFCETDERGCDITKIEDVLLY